MNSMEQKTRVFCYIDVQEFHSGEQVSKKMCEKHSLKALKTRLFLDVLSIEQGTSTEIRREKLRSVAAISLSGMVWLSYSPGIFSYLNMNLPVTAPARREGGGSRCRYTLQPSLRTEKLKVVS
jgi:hypothetical protein